MLKTNSPEPKDVYSVGTVGTIIQLLRLPDGTVKVLVEGKRRVRIKEFLQTDGFFMVDTEDIIEVIANETEAKALVRSVKSTFETYVKLNKRIPPEISDARIDHRRHRRTRRHHRGATQFETRR